MNESDVREILEEDFQVDFIYGEDSAQGIRYVSDEDWCNHVEKAIKLTEEKVRKDILDKIDKTKKKFMPITDVCANSFMDLRDQIFDELKKEISNHAQEPDITKPLLEEDGGRNATACLETGSRDKNHAPQEALDVLSDPFKAHQTGENHGQQLQSKGGEECNNNLQAKLPADTSEDKKIR